jgi:hypothetical protein
VEWIHLAQDRARWRAVVNAVMNLRILASRNWLVNYVAVNFFFSTSEVTFNSKMLPKNPI